MEAAPNFISEYSTTYKDENNITEKGAHYLSMSDWTALRKLDLYKNKIGSKGCQWLSKGPWNNI
jgi:hypothetical protein